MENAGTNEAATEPNSRERVVADLKTLMTDAEELLKVTAGDLSEKAREARTKVTAALSKVRGSLHGLEQKAAAGAKAADQMIRRHPYESLGVAFGLGVLIGVLINRR